MCVSDARAFPLIYISCRRTSAASKEPFLKARSLALKGFKLNQNPIQTYRELSCHRKTAGCLLKLTPRHLSRLEFASTLHCDFKSSDSFQAFYVPIPKGLLRKKGRRASGGSATPSKEAKWTNFPSALWGSSLQTPSATWPSRARYIS